MPFFNRFPFLVLALSGLLGGVPLAADIEDRFDTVRPSWQLREHDCGARVLLHRRDFSLGHDAPGCELVRIAAGQGTQALLGYSLPKTPLIDELNPTLWIRSDRFDLQFVARVVLPRSLDPRTGRPLVTFVRGDMYRRPGVWQELGIPHIRERLRRQVASLSAEHAIQVDPRQAYLAELLLNTYGGPGVTTVWIDDLSMTSPLVQVAGQRMGDATDPLRTVGLEQPSPGHIQLDGSLVIAGGRPLMVRMLEYHGEPFAWLKQLGFNALALKVPPSQGQLEEAMRLGIWLMAPPPSLGAQRQAPSPILAWDLGEHPRPGPIPQLVRRADAVRSQLQPQIPLSAGVSAVAASSLQKVDLVRLDWQPLFSSVSIPLATGQLKRTTERLDPGTPFWISVPSDVTPELRRQWRTLGVDQDGHGSVVQSQFREVVFRALAVGSRGLFFRSDRPLDSQHPRDQRRVRQLEQVLLELTLMDPWLAGGGPPEDITLETKEVDAVSTATNRSRLVWFFSSGRDGRLAGQGQEPREAKLPRSIVPESYQGYLLSGNGVEPLPFVDNSRGWLVQLSQPITTVILSDDPRALDFVRRKQEDQAVRRATNAAEQLADAWQVTNRVMDQLPVEVQRQQKWHSFRTQFSGPLQLSNDSPGERVREYTVTTSLAERLAEYRYGVQESLSSGFESPLSSPLCVCFETLPDHYRLGQWLKGRDWGPNRLNGGRCEDLAQLQTSGWRYYRSEREGMESRVELLQKGQRKNDWCLRMAVWGKNESTSGTTPSSSASRIETAPLNVQAGDIVCLRGWIRIPRPLAQGHDGLLVFDSIAGPSLGLRFYEGPAWRPFVIFRAADRAQPLTLSLALAGAGEVLMDDFSIHIIPADRAGQ